MVISTIQRVYALLTGEELAEDDEEAAPSRRDDPSAPEAVAYNPAMPPETFDIVIVDECHRSIYGMWRQVLEYFDAPSSASPRRPTVQTLGFFGKNLVTEYPYERRSPTASMSTFEVFRIRTEIGEQAARVEAGLHGAGARPPDPPPALCRSSTTT